MTMTNYEFNGKITELEAILKNHDKMEYSNVHFVNNNEKVVVINTVKEEIFNGRKVGTQFAKFYLGIRVFPLVEHITVYDNDGKTWYEIVATRRTASDSLTYFILNYKQLVIL